MLNVDKTIVAALQEIGLPVDYEMVISKGSTTPSITYYQLTNFVEQKYINEANVSVIHYTITLWTHKASDFDLYGDQIDEVMRRLGFRRTAANQLRDNQTTLMRMIMEYEARGQEVFIGD